MVKRIEDQNVGCEKCYEVPTDYYTTDLDTKVCKRCGGKALNLVEAIDRIAELKAEIDSITGDYE